MPAQLRATRLPLHADWTVEAVSGPVPTGLLDGPIPARVPGVVHTDLLGAGIIDDPFDGDNETAQQWIGDVVWLYRTRFTWHDDGAVRHDLVAEGLDTVAELRLNGVVVARTENQHRSYRFDVREHLVPGENVLEIEFAAPVPETVRRAELHGALPRVNHHDFNQLRKSAANFGWDWGIDVATSGIWRPIGIESWSGARIAAVRPLVDVDGETGVLTAHVEVERDELTEGELELAVHIDGQVERVALGAGERLATAVLTVPAVRRWWPREHGDQTLYPVEVTVAADRWEGRVGFRRVEVDTEPDQAGRPFAIRVNGRLVLVRGVNWIPDHAFATEIDPARIERRFDDMAEANVNLVRVWGGGVYESEDFYRLADERGLLVWQDFLFACAAYSEEEHLAVEVEAEAREQVTRLSAHASLVLWNGCNENIWGYADWGWPAQLQGRSWGDGYYRDLLPRIVAELDPGRPYSPGSPYSFGEYLHPDDPRNGTTHIWDVWNWRDWREYRDHRPRFVSEFGFQGPPAWSTLTRVVHDEPLDPYGPQMLVHQKARLGNRKLERGAMGHLPPFGTIEDWHWGTQLNQAHAVRFGIEHFRSLTPHNTGVIMWQLNDDWPVISWSAVDFDGHRKPLWHALRAAYAPRLATIQPRPSEAAVEAAFEGTLPIEDSLALVVVNDHDEAIESLAVLTRQRFDGTILAGATVPVRVAARATASVPLPAGLTTAGDRGDEVLLARTPGLPDAVFDFADVVDQRLDPAPLTGEVERTDRGYRVVVRARSYARDVTLLVDRLDPEARVDTGMVTLLAGGSAAFEVDTRLELDREALLAAGVLRMANDLLPSRA